jgi:hypothetical protein
MRKRRLKEWASSYRNAARSTRVHKTSLDSSAVMVIQTDS